MKPVYFRNALACSVICMGHLHAKGYHNQIADQNQDADFQRSERQASVISTQGWFDVVEQKHYGESWEKASDQLKRSVSQDEWEKIMQSLRGPLGDVKKRTIVQQLPSNDPKGMPKGHYMVILYNTSFANKASAKELVTLAYENGEWKVITYHVE